MFYYANKRRRNKKLILGIALFVIAALVILVIVFSGTIAGWFEQATTPAPSESPATSTPTHEPEPQKPLDESGLSVLKRFGVPEGFERVSVESGSFGAYLRQYPLKAYGTVAKFYDGTENTLAPTVGVLEQALISRNQESPDAVMMLYAQYLFENQAYGRISFDALTTPAFPIKYETWITGQRVRTNGNLLEWYMPEEGVPEAPSVDSLHAYLVRVMIHANSRSLKAQLMPVSTAAIQPGDLFIANGHVILVMDVCRNSETGEVQLICAQGEDKVAAEPNRQISESYVLYDAVHETVWLSLESDGSFAVGEDVYPADSLRRFQ